MTCRTVCWRNWKTSIRKYTGSGEVTFNFVASAKDAFEKLIAQLRTELFKTVLAIYVVAAPKKPGRSRPELNHRYLSMEAGEAMITLYLEWIDMDVIAISHTHMKNGNVMRDPEMAFQVDRDKGTLEPLTFQQNGFPQHYQKIYPEFGLWRPKLRNDLSRFAQQWLKNISQQRYHKHGTVAVRNDGNIPLTFDPDGKALKPASAVQLESGTPEVTPSPIHNPLAPADQVGDTVNEITNFLSAHLPETNEDLQEALIGDGGSLELRDKAVIAGYIQADKDNLKSVQRLADTYTATAETMTLLTEDQMDYFSDKSGFEVHIHDRFNRKVSITWNHLEPDRSYPPHSLSREDLSREISPKKSSAYKRHCSPASNDIQSRCSISRLMMFPVLALISYSYSIEPA